MMKKTIFLVAIIILFQANALAQNKNKVKPASVLENTQGFKGFFNFNYNEKEDALYLTVKELNKEFLYVNSLSAGVGNNDLGLDRGQLGDERVVYFSRSGNKLMLIQPNLRYRSTSDNPLEQRSIKEAFAKSVLFGFPIVESNNSGYVINLTPFLMQDAHGVSKRLKQRKQGSYSVDKSRSAVFLERTKAFPKNIEFDIMLTFAGTATGNMVQGVTPTPDAITVHQHHSFVELPDLNYMPRKFDPRSGANAFTFYDYTTPVSQPTKNNTSIVIAWKRKILQRQ